MSRPSEKLTVTRMTGYRICPRQWGYEHISGLPRPPTWIMVAGSAMDDTLTEHHAQRISGVNGLVGTALVDYYITKYRERVLKDQPFGKLDPDAERDGARLLPIYEEEVSSKIQPLEVQKEVSYSIAGQTYLGHIDLIRGLPDGSRVISDHKFTLSSPWPYKAAKSLQLRAYDLAEDDPCHKVELINLVRLKRKPKIVVQQHVVSARDREELISEFSQTATHVDAMLFPQCDPTSWACKPTQCSFYSICRGRPEGPEPILGER